MREAEETGTREVAAQTRAHQKGKLRNNLGERQAKNQKTPYFNEQILWVKMIRNSQIHIPSKYDFTIKLMGSRKKVFISFLPQKEFLWSRGTNQENGYKTSNDRVRNSGPCKEIIGWDSS